MAVVRNVIGMALAAALAACGKSPDQLMQAVQRDDCLDLPVYPPPGTIDLRQTAFACVERYAAMYAKGSDTPNAISDAVVVECQDEIVAYVTEAAKEAGEKPNYNGAINSWRRHALPVIAEARARKCYS